MITLQFLSTMTSWNVYTYGVTFLFKTNRFYAVLIISSLHREKPDIYEQSNIVNVNVGTFFNAADVSAAIFKAECTR